ncbi:acyl-CoA synthetase [Nocardioides marmoriginsengisoli]|uniref:Acyl-CoA synthetase n=1 Tax=Nocardioides marmoriginsengisoli TaxID=661483 RepID=A0A3N0CN55_9ACTN|nr:acyl-CoA synthetase [Nocardioides marmoriginsengisoli]RNL64897.1 acyl-CoA synthetase [Nocardioides marmoriginsengisoli]
MTEFNLSRVFSTVAATVPDQEVLVWRERRLTYAAMEARIDGVAHYLAGQGLGRHRDRGDLAGHEIGQDTVGLYLRNGNEYPEAMLASYRAGAIAFNINYQYVEEELVYLLNDAGAAAIVFHAEFAPRMAAILDRVPSIRVLIQVADESGHALLPGAVDYESTTTTPPVPLPEALGEDAFLLYTGGTTGMPKGVIWRQHDVYVAAMGGRPFGSPDPYTSYEEIAEACRTANGGIRLLMTAPFMHGAAQWSSFHMISTGGRIVLPSDVHHMDAVDWLRTTEREGVMSIPVVGDAMARPLVDELERGDYDLSGLAAINNGGAPISPGVRHRIHEALPNILILDAVGSSETGIQMNHYSAAGAEAETAVFNPEPSTTVVDDEHTRALRPGEGGGWLARTELVPLGYLGDAEKTARTFPVIDGVRYSVPGDRAELLEDGRIRLLGRDAVTINSGGEKIFAEEVERALAAHPDISDVIVAGRPSERWGSEVVAIVALRAGSTATDEDLIAEAAKHVARYKLPKAIVRRESIARSPSGKADYRWAKQQALGT